MNSNPYDRLLQVDWDLNIQGVFIKAWNLFKSQALLFVSFSLLIFSLAMVFVYYLQPYTILFSIFLAPPLYAGFYLVANKIRRGEEVIYPDFFGGFNYGLLAIGISLFSQLVVGIGLVFLILPGIYFLVAYLLAVPMGIFAGTNLWTSMELSRVIVTRFWWKFFVLLVLLIVYNGLGALLLGVGILITFPMTFLVIYVVFEELTMEVLADSDPQIIHEPES